MNNKKLQNAIETIQKYLSKKKIWKSKKVQNNIQDRLTELAIYSTIK